jgi:hypothetical protein
MSGMKSRKRSKIKIRNSLLSFLLIPPSHNFTVIITCCTDIEEENKNKNDTKKTTTLKISIASRRGNSIKIKRRNVKRKSLIIQF